MKVALLQEKLSSIPEINVERGMRYSVGNAGNYRKALYMALKSIKFKVPIMINMMEENEYNGLRVIIHTLMQLLENVGAEALVRECRQMEEQLLNEQMSLIKESMEEYIRHLTGFVIRLEQVMPEVDSVAALAVNVEMTPSQRLERRKNSLTELYSEKNTKVV